MREHSRAWVEADEASASGSDRLYIYRAKTTKNLSIGTDYSERIQRGGFKFESLISNHFLWYNITSLS